MEKKYLLLAALVAGAAVAPCTVGASQALLAPGDASVAIGETLVNASSYPAKEFPANIADQDPATKYLNFGTDNTGFIITPIWGPSTIKRVQFTTANDDVQRDPVNFKIYGTNDPITSVDNGTGDSENWELIAEGDCQLPEDRLTAGPMIDFANEKMYTSYKVLFVNVKDATHGDMQIGDVQFFETPSSEAYEGEWGILSIDDALAEPTGTIAFQLATKSNSDHTTTGNVNIFGGTSFLFDGNKSNMYLNNAKQKTGFIVSPAAGMTKLESFKIYTGDSPDMYACCDPISYRLYGTLDQMTSADNSAGTAEEWTLISEGPLNLPVARSQWSDDIFVDCADYYRCYKMVFDDIRDPNDEKAIAMMVSEIQFYGEKEVSSVGDPIFRPGDVARLVNANPDVFYVTQVNTGSRCPAAEIAPKAIDGTADNKYLNYCAAEGNGDGKGAGIIVVTKGSSVAKSMKLWTANDDATRDPQSWEVYGTNEEVVSTEHGDGMGEQWTLIASGDNAGLPADRKVEGPLLTFPENTAAFKAYKIMFPTNKGAALMQVGEIQLYKDVEGTNGIFAADDTAIAIRRSVVESVAQFQPGDNKEGPQSVVDNQANTKSYARTGPGTGYIISPMNSLSIAKGLYIITGNDSPERDPMTYELYGTMDEIISDDFSTGTAENWTKISEGELNTPTERMTKSEVIEFDNSAAYSSYKIIFPTLRNSPDKYQVADVQLLGQILKAAPQSILNSETDSFLAFSATLKRSSDHYNGDERNVNAFEGAEKAFDGGATYIYNGVEQMTKYLNLCTDISKNIGVIYSPADGKKRGLTSMIITTANDAPERDPGSYILYGTDDPITSEDNSDGMNENWTKVAEGTLALPDDRQVSSEQYMFNSNGDPTPAFKNWKFVFPTRKAYDTFDGVTTAAALQFAEIELFDENWDSSWMDPENDTALAIGDMSNNCNYPSQEGPKAVADGLITVKFLNRGRDSAGFIVTLDEPAVANALQYTSANDRTDRSPLDYIVFGTDEDIKSVDMGLGNEEEWTLLGEGVFTGASVGKFIFRNTDIMFFDNDKAWKSYKVLFPNVSASADFMQVAECYLYNLEQEPVIETPVLTWVYEDGKLVLSWNVGNLEVSSDLVNWTAINATSPYSVVPDGKLFYRAAN